jgi:hypothetical protein
MLTAGSVDSWINILPAGDFLPPAAQGGRKPLMSIDFGSMPPRHSCCTDVSLT